ncbi:MAG: GNAT family N-acetyltransferase [Burkholderiales bacterium]|nr:GNAT family N-acetyltransferase [Burkholderiales bacterium]
MSSGLPSTPGGSVPTSAGRSAGQGNRLDAAELLALAPTSFSTEHCHLEQIRVDHAPMLREAVLTSHADLGFIDWAQGHWDLERARRFCRKSATGMAQGGYLSYLAFERLPSGLIGSRLLRGRYIGLLDLHSFDWRVPRCQIGYVGDSAQRGRGLMREAALALMKAAHGWGLHRIEAWCDARNTRSQHFADALGLAYEGRMRQCEIDVSGQPCDQMVYARIATDPWPP